MLGTSLLPTGVGLPGGGLRELVRPRPGGNPVPVAGWGVRLVSGAEGGNLMPGVYTELRDFVLAHRECAGPRRADASLATPSGYSLIVRCGCGQEFTPW